MSSEIEAPKGRLFRTKGYERFFNLYIVTCFLLIKFIQGADSLHLKFGY
jgi:hypothetical protein